MGADMFVHSLVFLILTTTLGGPSGFPLCVADQWIDADGSLQYEDFDGEFMGVEETMWPDNMLEVVELDTPEDQELPAAPLDPYVMKEQASGGDDSSVWKALLVVAILLVSIVGSMSLAYYLCVWRGGRIHYRPHRDVSAFI